MPKRLTSQPKIKMTRKVKIIRRIKLMMHRMSRKMWINSYLRVRKLTIALSMLMPKMMKRQKPKEKHKVMLMPMRKEMQMKTSMPKEMTSQPMKSKLKKTATIQTKNLKQTPR